jgi:sec-independent protein translocase protein TatA
MFNPLIAMPGTGELILIFAVIILLFGAAKLPDLARGTGQALRIFKAETKGLRDDDDKDGDKGLPTSMTDETTPVTPAAPAAPETPADKNLS